MVESMIRDVLCDSCKVFQVFIFKKTHYCYWSKDSEIEQIMNELKCGNYFTKDKKSCFYLFRKLL